MKTDSPTAPSVTAHLTGTAFIWHPTKLPYHGVSFLLSALSDEPVYHNPDGPYGREVELEDGSYVFRLRSRCGRVLYQESVRSDGTIVATQDFDERVPAGRAIRFGKPCFQCWPEIREVFMETEEQ